MSPGGKPSRSRRRVLSLLAGAVAALGALVNVRQGRAEVQGALISGDRIEVDKVLANEVEAARRVYAGRL